MNLDWAESHSHGMQLFVKSFWCGIQQNDLMRYVKKWEDSMLKREGVVDDAAKELSQKPVVEGIVDVYNNISINTRQNAWQ